MNNYLCLVESSISLLKDSHEIYHFLFLTLCPQPDECACHCYDIEKRCFRRFRAHRNFSQLTAREKQNKNVCNCFTVCLQKSFFFLVLFACEKKWSDVYFDLCANYSVAILVIAIYIYVRI